VPVRDYDCDASRPDVEPQRAQSAPILKPFVGSALIPQTVRQRVAAEPVRLAAESERSPRPIVGKLSDPMKAWKRS
jgi:hypothetical protein